MLSEVKELDRLMQFEKVAVKWDWRHMSSPDVCYLIRDLEDQLEYTKCPGRRAWLDWCLEIGYKELEDRVNFKPIYTDSKGVIMAIKEKCGFNGLVEIIDRYTDIHVYQSVYTFNCPLHSDKHASGHIYKDKLIWKCFQCQEWGDVFDAVTKFGRVSFGDAIRDLALFTGILLKGNKRLSTNNTIYNNIYNNVNRERGNKYWR